ncbi:hypothetical protein CJU89_6066 [Yarrowia sp. B02]|nr:hypothetical protein CJU89_6066 [Yarrowia sp. B02]
MSAKLPGLAPEVSSNPPQVPTFDPKWKPESSPDIPREVSTSELKRKPGHPTTAPRETPTSEPKRKPARPPKVPQQEQALTRLPPKAKPQQPVPSSGTQNEDELRHELMMEMFEDYFLGDAAPEMRDQDMRDRMKRLKGPNKTLENLYEIVYKKASSNDVGSLASLLELLWNFDPILTQAMQVRGDRMKEMLYLILASFHMEYRLSLPQLAHRVTRALSPEYEDLGKCILLAVDVAKDPPSLTWDDLTKRAKYRGLLLMGQADEDTVRFYLKVLGFLSWPPKERELISVVETTMSKTKDKFTPIQILHAMTRMALEPNVHIYFRFCDPSEMRSRLHATLLLLKPMERLLFSREKRDRERMHQELKVALPPATKQKHISPRRIRTLEIEAKVAELADRRALADQKRNQVQTSAPARAVPNEPKQSVVSSWPYLPLAETSANPQKPITEHKDVLNTLSHELEPEMDHLPDSASSPPPLLHSTKMSAAEARDKVGLLQPGVGKYLEFIQGHDPHVAKAFLVCLLMGGQVTVDTTLEQVKRMKLRYPRHEAFFVPKDDKLILLLMREGHVKPSKLNRLYKRHLAADIQLRLEFLLYLSRLKR